MNIEQYFHTTFLSELRRLHFQKPNSLMLSEAESFGIDRNTQFFGGQEWERCEKDLNVSNYKNYFVLSLFAMACNDLNMHANFKPQYLKFRTHTQYPKFGWTGFGPHFESPEWLITKPISLGLVQFNSETLQEFTALWKSTASEFFTRQMPEITPTEFFEKLCADEVFTKSAELTEIKNYLQQN